MSEAASLSAGLLARKGGAAPVTFVPKVLTMAPPRRRGAARRVAVRLDEGRMLKLRLLAAHLGVTRQELLLRAFDAFVEQEKPGACLCLGECEGSKVGRACTR
jgi:hypothetical protein